MAYNEEKLARLKHLKQLAQKAKAESDAVAPARWCGHH